MAVRVMRGIVALCVGSALVVVAPPVMAAPASPAAASPRVAYDGGAVNVITKASTSTVRLVKGKVATVRLTGVDSDAGGVLLQLSVDASSGVSVSAGPTAKGPFTTAVSASKGGTTSGTALVAGNAAVYLTATANATVRVTPLAWIADSEREIAAGGMGIAIPVTRLDTSQGFGDNWLSGGRDVQLTGLGGIPSRRASAVLASITMTPTRQQVTLSYSISGTTTPALTSEAGQVITGLAFLPVDDRGRVKLQTSGAARVAITPVGWVARGRFDLAPVTDGAVQPIVPQSLVKGALPTSKVLAPSAVPAQAGAIPLLSVRVAGSGRLTAGSSVAAATSGTITGILPAASRSSRPRLLAQGQLAGDVIAVGWVLAGPLNDSTAPQVRVNGGPKLTEKLSGDGQFLLSGTVSDASGIARVQVEIPSSNEGYAYATVDPYTGSWSLPYAPPDGTWDIVVTAYDRDGNDADATVTASITAADPYEMLVAPNVVQISSSTREQISRVTATLISFTSPSSPVNPGDIISIAPGGKTPDGALRHVLAVSPDASGNWIVYTLQAEPTDALLQATIGVTDDSRAEYLRAPNARTPRDFTIEDEVTVPYSFVKEASKSYKSKGGAVAGNAKIKGTISGKIIFRLKVFVETCWLVPCGGHVDFFQLRVENTLRVDAEVHGTVGKKENVIDDWPLSSPIDTGAFMLGPVPFTTSLQPMGYVDLEAQLDVTAYAQKNSALQFTYLHNGGWQSPEVDIAQPLQWQVSVTFDGKAEAGIKLIEAIKVAGLLGPNFILRGGLLGVEGHASLLLNNNSPSPACDVLIKVYSVLGLGIGLEAGAGDNPWRMQFAEATWPHVWYEWPKEDLCPDPPAFSTWILEGLFGGGVDVEIVAQLGSPRAVAAIDSGDLIGTAFSTGDLAALLEGYSDDTPLGTLGSAILDRITDKRTSDASITDLSITPSGRTLEIAYRLISDEYGSERNRGDDAVAILVDGRNCATTEEGRPVTSANTEPDPEANTDLPLAGISVPLLCRVPVVPHKPVAVKILVADAGKPGLDTALFIPAEGITSE